MKIFLRILSICYFVGACLHALDIFDLRLKLSEMDTVWRFWIVYLCSFDLLAAVGLWLQRKWGIALFFIVALSQLVAYTGFTSTFGGQTPLIIFHALTLTIFFLIKTKTGKRNEI